MSRLEHVLFNCKKSEIGFEDLDLLWHGTKKKENYKKIIHLFFNIYYLYLYVYNSLVWMP